MKYIGAQVFILLLIFAGCSSGGDNPLVPSNNGSSDFIQNPTPSSIAYPHAVSSDDTGSGVGVFGIYNLHLNTANLTADLTPIRNADLGGVYEADITSFLGSLCSDCLKVVSVGLTEENSYLEIVFRLHHPIPLPEDPFDPKLSDRLDLHLFDVRGIIIAEGDRIFTGFKADVDGDGNITEVLRCNPSLVNNADGYTTFFDTYMDLNGVTTRADLHPYKLFFKDPKAGNYQPEVNPINGWITLSYPQGQNVFPQGDLTSDASYIFDIEPGKVLDLVMVLDACYGHSAQFSIPYPNVGSRMNPRYFLPEFHRKEAWFAYVNITNNMLAHGDPLGTAALTVTIYDWQAGMTGSGPIDYFNSELAHLSATSDVNEVVVFLPELMSQPLTTYISKTGSGTWLNPYVYNFSLTNELDPEGGTFYGIVAIKDHLANSGYGPQGVGRDLSAIKITDFVNYQVFPLSVSAVAPNQPPMAMFTTIPLEPTINSGETVSFDASASFDPDGEITLYEWDFEFDGLEFMTDDTGATPAPHAYFNSDPSMPMIYFALLKVTDNGVSPMQNMFGMEIVVLPNSPPFAVIMISPGTSFSECDLVTLDGSRSRDDTGITTYEWDFDYDPGVPEFNVDATGVTVRRRFNPGSRNIMLRVTDDSDLTGVTRMRITSEPLSGDPGEVDFCGNYLLDQQDGTNSNTYGSGGLHNVVLLPNWMVAALWVDESGGTVSPAIKCSFSADGGRTFDIPEIVNTVSLSSGLQNLRPCLSADSTGRLHVGYSDGDGTYYYHQKSGDNPFTERVMVGTGSRIYGGPSITIDTAGDIYYFFTGVEAAGNVPLKLAISTDGGNSFNSPSTLAADGRFPSAVSASSGSSAIAFEGKNVPLSDSSDIFACYQRAGTTFYPPIRVVDSNPNDGKSTLPSMAINSTGSVYIAWQDSRNGDTDQDYDIYYAYSVSGLTFSSNVRVNNTNESPGSQILQNCSSIGVDMTGTVFVAWCDYRDGSGGDVYFAYSVAPGSTITENARINDDTLSLPEVTQGPPLMVVSPNSGILIIWADERNSSNDLGTLFSGPADIYYTFGKLF